MGFTRAVCEVIAQTESPGLSESTIVDLLMMVGVAELEPGPNKRTRLYATLNNVQVRQGSGNVLIAFITRAMNPARYARDPQSWRALRADLDEVLVHYGLRINELGQLVRGQQARGLNEAAELAGSLRTELRSRGTHEKLLAYCADEVISNSLFHALTEAAKSVPDRIRTMIGIHLDGQELYNEVFGSEKQSPKIFINARSTPSEVSAHKGFKNLLVGVHGHFRNPRAHSSRLGSEEDRQDFLETMAMLSYIHRVLDSARVQKDQ
uniref:TIGR02391 family protein n=1 Tax=Pigmentiphaga litoralis TaxID=516702 RepID=UPI0038998247